MEKENLIGLDIFCASHKIEFSFVNSLRHMGMIEIEVVQEKEFIKQNQLDQLEKIIRLHHELEINLQGIESITHILLRMEELMDENIKLKNKLRIYEDEK